MDWSNERYVRIYVRDTLTWKRLKFEGQALFCLLLRKVDRTGIIEIGDAPPWEAAMFLLEAPEEVAKVGMQRLLDLKVIEHVGDKLIVPNFVEAQEATMSTIMRQKEHRLRRRDLARAGLDPSQRETAIYFIQSENGGEIKIGRADDVAKRLVGLQTSRPDKLVLLAAAAGTLAQERELHAMFAEYRVKGEWFSPVPELLALVTAVVKHGSDAFETRDWSQTVTDNKTFAVTPSRTVPSRTVPSHAPSRVDAREGGGLETPRAIPPTPPEQPTDSVPSVSSGADFECVEMFRKGYEGHGTMPTLFGQPRRAAVLHCQEIARSTGKPLHEVALAVCRAAQPGAPNWNLNLAKVDPYAPQPALAPPRRGGRIEPTLGTTGEDFKDAPSLAEQRARAAEHRARKGAVNGT